MSFGHVLSDFTGPVRVGEASVAVDREAGEVLVAEARDVRVFNHVGMQLFGFRTPRNLAGVLDLAVEADGNLITLALDLDAPGDRPRVVITRHNFRGIPVEEIIVSGAPPPFDGMQPNTVFSRGEKLILANTGDMIATVVDPQGTFERGYDLAEILEIPEEDRDSLEITGLAIDDAGNLLITCAILFSAFVVSPEGELVAIWGEPGSIPGTFGVASGIARDASGRTYVADKGRGVVMVFDQQYKFLQEFGHELTVAGRVGMPSEVFVDGAGRVYLTQVGRRGVWVYNVRTVE